MPIAQPTSIDPLQAFMAGAFVAGTKLPCPLVATRYDVMIDAGLAVVAMTRTFRNAEPHSIEATITFPVPVHAALFALEVKIGARVLKAHAQRKEAARAHYEAALDRGKTAVLHEEVLRGVHMLSVGHIAPAAEVEVRAIWVMTLTNLDGRGRLRIPLTVGDVYGRSGLSDSDALIHGGPQQIGTLRLDCRDGTATLLGARLENAQAEIALNVPIDIEVDGWTPRALRGRAADGRAVALTIEPYAANDTALDVAVIIDHSGSMSECCSTADGLTKHEAVRSAIEALARQLGSSDIVDLWEFSSAFRHVGSTRTTALTDLARQLVGPNGGTEIGRALAGVLAGTSARDVLLVTDGKSHALDVQALARSGRRFSVVLVGADSLEAHMGHLAALTAGEIFVSAGSDIGTMLDAAIRSLRSPHTPARLDGGQICEHRAGMAVTARWQGAVENAEQTAEARAVAALAACLLLPTLSEEEAAKLAEAEGLVTHLSSLVLVDEEGVTQEGIPATRKIALPTPANFVVAATAPSARPRLMRMASPSLYAPQPSGPQQERPSAGSAAAYEAPRDFEADAPGRSRRSLLNRLGGLFATRPAADLAALCRRIPWELAPQRLQEGDLSDLEPNLAQTIRRLAGEPMIARTAKDMDCDPVALVIALLARVAAPRNRAAARVARAILGERPTGHLEAQLARHVQDGVPM
jgi:hypothetical protein